MGIAHRISSNGLAAIASDIPPLQGWQAFQQKISIFDAGYFNMQVNFEIIAKSVNFHYKLTDMDQQNPNTFLGTEEQPSYLPNSDERTAAILSHILTLVCGFIAPLVIYLVKKDDSKFVAEHSKESLNFQITLFIGYCVAFLTLIILVGILLFIVLGILQLVLVIVATLRASENKYYRYPFSIRLIK